MLRCKFKGTYLLRSAITINLRYYYVCTPLVVPNLFCQMYSSTPFINTSVMIQMDICYKSGFCDNNIIIVHTGGLLLLRSILLQLFEPFIHYINYLNFFLITYFNHVSIICSYFTMYPILLTVYCKSFITLLKLF